MPCVPCVPVYDWPDEWLNKHGLSWSRWQGADDSRYMICASHTRSSGNGDDEMDMGHLMEITCEGGVSWREYKRYAKGIGVGDEM